LTDLPTGCTQILPIVVQMYQITSHQNEVHKWNLQLYIFIMIYFSMHET